MVEDPWVDVKFEPFIVIVSPTLADVTEFAIVDEQAVAVRSTDDMEGGGPAYTTFLINIKNKASIGIDTNKIKV
jgi:hypothetical protein